MPRRGARRRESAAGSRVGAPGTRRMHMELCLWQSPAPAGAAPTADSGGGRERGRRAPGGALLRLSYHSCIGMKNQSVFSSTMTGTWSDGFGSHPRASRRIRWLFKVFFNAGVTQTWSSRRPRSAAFQSRAR